MLQSADVLLENHSHGMASVTSLRKIEAISIDSFVERNGKLFYIIDVYLQRPESRIPTNIRTSKAQQQQQQQQQKQKQKQTKCLASDPTSNRQPDFQVERSFSEFAKLRSKLYRQAQNSHSMLRCGFCDDIVNSTLLSVNQPKRFMNLLFSRNVLARILTHYVSNLLEIIARSKKNNGCRACFGQEQIPQLVLAFLLQPEAQSF